MGGRYIIAFEDYGCGLGRIEFPIERLSSCRMLSCNGTKFTDLTPRIIMRRTYLDHQKSNPLE